MGTYLSTLIKACDISISSVFNQLKTSHKPQSNTVLLDYGTVSFKYKFSFDIVTLTVHSFERPFDVLFDFRCEYREYPKFKNVLIANRNFVRANHHSNKYDAEKNPVLLVTDNKFNIHKMPWDFTEEHHFQMSTVLHLEPLGVMNRYKNFLCSEAKEHKILTLYSFIDDPGNLITEPKEHHEMFKDTISGFNLLGTKNV